MSGTETVQIGVVRSIMYHVIESPREGATLVRMDLGKRGASLSDQLSDLYTIRDTLATCETVKSAIDQCLNLTRRHVNSQTASLFLFGKDGRLRRQAIKGEDKEGNAITDAWFVEEAYLPGASFTGQAVSPPLGSTSLFGMPRWSSELSCHELNDQSKLNYLDKLGALACAVAIPLNGHHRSFGVLEVINRLLPTGRPDPAGIFLPEEIYWLSIMGIAISGVITRFRLNDELALLTSVSRMMGRPFSEEDNPSRIYGDLVRYLTGPLTAYKASILLLADTPETLKIAAKAGDGVSWDDRINAPIRRGEKLVGRVFQSGHLEIVDDIEKCEGDFQNIKWMRSNTLRATACFPLTVKSRIIGTLSLFTGYPYSFDENEVEFLSSISSLVASLAEAFELAGKLRLGDLEIAEERHRIIGNARAAGYDHMVTELMHGYKNTLQRLRTALAGLDTSTSGRTNKVLESQTMVIETEIAKISEQFRSCAHTRVNVNHVLKSVAKYFSLELKGMHVQVVADYEELPDIEASEAEMRDIFVNLTSNAVRAIQAAGRQGGRIEIATRMVKLDRDDYMEITVGDNGCGIRKDERERIFKQGFSRYVGGTGMGLYLTRKIVNAYGGRISFDSTIGKGTVFSVRLPLKELQWDEGCNQ